MKPIDGKQIANICKIIFVGMIFCLNSCKYFIEPEPYVNKDAIPISNNGVTILVNGHPYSEGQQINTFIDGLWIDLIPDTTENQVFITGVIVDSIGLQNKINGEVFADPSVIRNNTYGEVFADSSLKTDITMFVINNHAVIYVSTGKHDFCFKYKIYNPKTALGGLKEYKTSEIALKLTYDF